ncbi:hypothetical protein GCM10028803_07540 [Larkinella knui]|uniref:Uncharacterized protein n=2 Tax=Larkinella knui TaxID=2025310 RepID=A0A3P1CJQ4_9BACT|nr:hypothetical protein EHT87_15025 [Larkinella knui]
MTINELEQMEGKLLLHVNNTQGSIEEKTDQLEAGSIFDAYKQVHSHYADLAQEDSEALIRG